MLSLSIFDSPARASGEPSVGVEKGDWIEYNVNITGTPPPIHDVTWMKIEVLQVENSAFPVNLTVRYVNGTLYSTIWKFNFTAGNDEGWIMIPPNLGPADTFYDAYSKTNKNVTIQRQDQETVLGASRTVTYANQSSRYKEWDKATGIFVHSSETFKNWSADVNIIATNLWSPQILGIDPTMFYALTTGAAVLLAVSVIFVIVIVRNKGVKSLECC